VLSKALSLRELLESWTRTGGNIVPRSHIYVPENGAFSPGLKLGP